MPKKILTEGKCQNCPLIIPYIPRKIFCVDCYKKLTNWTKPIEEVKFIEDE